MQLDREQIENLRRKNVENIRQRVEAGKTLTRAQQAELEAYASGGSLGGSDTTGFVKTKDELAAALGVSRRTITSVFERYRNELPGTRADGRYCIAEWAAFFREKNIAGSAEDEESDGATGGPPQTQNDWKKRELELKCAKLETELKLAQGALTVVADLERDLGITLSAFRTALNNLPGRAASELIGLDDYHEITSVLQSEIDVVLRTLSGCAWLQDAIAASGITTPSVAERTEPEEDEAEVFHVAQQRPGKGRKNRKPTANAANVAPRKRAGNTRDKGPQKVPPSQKAAKRKAAGKARPATKGRGGKRR